VLGVQSLRGFQNDAAAVTKEVASRVFLNVSTEGGKTLLLMWPVVCDALSAPVTPFSLSLCFVLLLALQSDHLLCLRDNERLNEVLHVLSLSKEDDVKALDALLTSRYLEQVCVVVSEPRTIFAAQEQASGQWSAMCVDYSLRRGAHVCAMGYISASI
jgi:hypothetical protein